MQVVNRSALIVRPKKPFLDWVNFCDDKYKMTLEEIREEPNVYLIPEIEEPANLERYLAKNCKKIFKHQLYSYYTDPKLHPKDLSLKFFKEWFDYEVLSMVMDALDGKIEKEC